MDRQARLYSQKMNLSSEWVSMGSLTHADAALRLAEINSFAGIVETKEKDGEVVFRHLVEPVTTYKVTSYRGDD